MSTHHHAPLSMFTYHHPPDGVAARRDDCPTTRPTTTAGVDYLSRPVLADGSVSANYASHGKMITFGLCDDHFWTLR